MKKQLILGLALVSMIFSCSTDDTADIIINDNSVTNNTSGGGSTDPQTIFLSGTYTEYLTLYANITYKLTKFLNYEGILNNRFERGSSRVNRCITGHCF